MWCSLGSFAGPIYKAWAHKNKNIGFNLEQPPTLPWENSVLPPLVSYQVPTTSCLSGPRYLAMHHSVPPLVVLCPCVSTGIDFLAPLFQFQSCSLLPALAPNPASWRKERRRCSCLIPTANLGANSAKRAMWHFSERLAAWEEGGSVYDWPCWNTQLHNSSCSPCSTCLLTSQCRVY